MPVTPPPNMDARVEAEMQELRRRQEQAILRRLQYIGEEAINTARTNRKYLDQTGNLTSSIGYVIVRAGSIVVKGGFDQTKEGAEGVQTGEGLANEVSSNYLHDYTLIVVAGMDYAEYIETRGLGGMTAAELEAKDKIEKFINKFK